MAKPQGPIFRRPSIKVFKGSYKSNWLVIPDAHIPFEHPKALPFLKDVQELYQIPDSNVVSLGDLLDLYHFTRFPKGADYKHTPMQEIEMAREKIKQWAKAFPELKICRGNHEDRVGKRAFEAELPSVVTKSVRDLFGFPDSWSYEECYVMATKSPFLCLHGDGEGISISNLNNNPRQFGMSVAFGHFHSQASICHVGTATLDAWSFHVGFIGDESSYVFEYGKRAKFKPSIGCGVILDEGRCPIWIPLV